LEKKGGHYIREDDRLFQGDDEKSLWDGNAFGLIEISHKKLQLQIEKQGLLYENDGICQPFDSRLKAGAFSGLTLSGAFFSVLKDRN
jgi:hypothetical protein